MNSSCRCSRSSLERTSCSSLSRTRCRPVRSSPRSLRSFGEALSRRSEPSSSTARSIALATCASAGSTAAASSRRSGAGRLVERGAGTQRAGRGVGDAPQRLRRERASESGVGRLVADVADPFERRLERLVEERDRLGRQCLAPSHLAGVGRRLELGGECSAVLGRGGARDPLPDRGKLQHVERVRVHPTECRLGDHGRHGLRRGADGLAEQVRGRRGVRPRRPRPAALHLDELPGRLRLHRGDARRGRRPARRARARRRADVPRLPHPRPRRRRLPHDRREGAGREGDPRAAEGSRLDARARHPRHPVRVPRRDRALLPGLQGSRGEEDGDARLRQPRRGRAGDRGSAGARGLGPDRDGDPGGGRARGVRRAGGRAAAHRRRSRRGARAGGGAALGRARFRARGKRGRSRRRRGRARRRRARSAPPRHGAAGGDRGAAAGAGGTAAARPRDRGLDTAERPRGLGAAHSDRRRRRQLRGAAERRRRRRGPAAEEPERRRAPDRRRGAPHRHRARRRGAPPGAGRGRAAAGRGRARALARTATAHVRSSRCRPCCRS